MYCHACGAELSAQSTFCPDCGANLDADSTSTSEASSGKRIKTDGIGVERTVGTGTAVGSLEPNVAGALAYVLGPITGLIVYLLEDRNQFVRFHAAQSMVVFGALWALAIVASTFNTFLWATSGIFFLLIDLLFSLVWLVVALATFGLWVYLIVRAYQGDTPRIPVAAKIADGWV